MFWEQKLDFATCMSNNGEWNKVKAIVYIYKDFTCKKFEM